MVDWVGGTDGELSYSFYPALDGTYEIHVGADPNDCGNCWAYELKLFEGEEPIDWDTPTSLANGIYVDNRNGTGAVTISNVNNRWFGNNSAYRHRGSFERRGHPERHGPERFRARRRVDQQHLRVTGAPGVTLTSVNFSNNDLTSAHIMTRGPVTVTNSEQGGNRSYGFYINNEAGTALSPITMTNVNLNNWGTTETGVYLRSDGAVTLTNVTSNGNGNDGFDIQADGAVKFTLVNAYGNDGYGAYVVTPGTFTILSSPTGISWFTDNSDTGLYVEAGGAISLGKVNAMNNGWREEGSGNPVTYAHGIYLENTNGLGASAITLTSVTANHNTMDGIFIDTNGAVTVNTLQVNDNDLYGLYIDQSTAPNSTKAITLNLVTANDNGWDVDNINGWDGIYVDAKGSIITNSITLINNAASGAVFFNRYDGATGTVTMLNTLGSKVNVVVSNGHSNGMGSGVSIISNGAVTISQLESIMNALNGLDVNNQSTGIIKPAVTLNNVITRFNIVGLSVKSSGVVTINTSWATNNTQDGIYIDTDNHVNILNTASVMNNWTGIFVYNSGGPFTLKLTGSAWFGNLRDDPYPDTNLMKIGVWTVVY